MDRVGKFKRGSNGYWYTRYRIGGRPIDESARTQDEALAEHLRLRREIEINAGIQPLQHAEMDELVRLYLECLPPQTSKKHRHEVHRTLQGFLQLCGRKRADGTHWLQTQQVTPAVVDYYIRRRAATSLHQGDDRDMRGWRIVRKRPVSNVTLRTELRYLSGFFNWCCRQRPPFLRENPIPLSNASAIRNDPKPHFMITDDELRALLCVCVAAGAKSPTI